FCWRGVITEAAGGDNGLGRNAVIAGHSRPKDGVLSHAYVAGIHVLASTSLLAAEDVTHDPPSGCRAGYGGREKRTLTTP
ncbi:MAG: hypothetical protein WB382_01395, partial [Pseudolabrys sp.]